MEKIHLVTSAINWLTILLILLEVAGLLVYLKLSRVMLVVEMWGAEAYALLTTLVVYFAELPLPEENVPVLMRTSATVFAVVMGFTGTGLCTLVSMNTSLTKQLKESGYMGDISIYISRALLASFVLVALAFFKIAYDSYWAFTVPLSNALWFGAMVYAFFCYFRVAKILTKFLTNADN